jgi:hypothetical protein
MSELGKPWQDLSARAAARARNPGKFVEQHISPLAYRETEGTPNLRHLEVTSEEHFWSHGGEIMFGTVALRGFQLSDWFPRTPGVYCSRHARRAREKVWSGPSESDPQLGQYYSPDGKMNLIEEGGIGTIRLRPRNIDGELCWLSTALTEGECHQGIPLAIPDSLLRQSNVRWGDHVFLEGRVRFLHDLGLDEPAYEVHHARSVIIFVESLRGEVGRRRPAIITPVALFGASEAQRFDHDQLPRYTFVHCQADSDRELDDAIDWIESYAAKYKGQVVTNFDEQRPNLADAPLSYQRLVTRTHDHVVIENWRL